MSSLSASAQNDVATGTVEKKEPSQLIEIIAPDPAPDAETPKPAPKPEREPLKKEQIKPAAGPPAPGYRAFDASAALAGLDVLTPAVNKNGTVAVVGRVRDRRFHTAIVLNADGTLRWAAKIEFSGAVTRPLLDDDDKLSLLSVGSELFLFGPDGALLEHRVFGYSYGYYSATVEGEYAAHLRSNPNEIHLLKPDGEIIWKSDCGAVGAAPHEQLLADGSVTIVNTAGRMCRFDRATGRGYTLPFDAGLIIHSTYAKDGGLAVLYGTPESARLERIGPLGREKLWITVPLPNAADVRTLSDGGFLVVRAGGEFDTALLKIDAASGLAKWNLKLPEFISNIAVTAGGPFYVASWQTAEKYNVAAYGVNGTEMWRRPGFESRELEYADAADNLVLRSETRTLVYRHDGSVFFDWNHPPALTASADSAGETHKYAWVGADLRIYMLDGEFAADARLPAGAVTEPFLTGAIGETDARPIVPPYDPALDGSIETLNCSGYELPESTVNRGAIDLALDSQTTYIISLQGITDFRLTDSAGASALRNPSLSLRAAALAADPRSGILPGAHTTAAFSPLTRSGTFTLHYEVPSTPTAIRICVYKWLR